MVWEGGGVPSTSTHRAVASTPDDSEFCSFEGRGPRGNVPPDADDEGSAEPTGGNGVTPQAGMTGTNYAGESGVLPHDESQGGGGAMSGPRGFSEVPLNTSARMIKLMENQRY